MTTLNVVPAGIGADGVITSLVSLHALPCETALRVSGAQAGGFGLVALTGLVSEAWWASGAGSSGPLGSPGEGGCLCAQVGGTPSIVIDWMVMSGPGVVAVLEMLFLRSKSRLNSDRHCVACWVRSTWVPGRNLSVGAS